MVLERGGDCMALASTNTVMLTRAQRVAMKRAFDRQRENGLRHYRTFRRGATIYPDGSGCVMIAWLGMYLGIEKDGHTHS